MANPQIAAISLEVLVQGIRAQNSPSRDLVALAQRRPALHINVRLQPAAGADRYIFFDYRILADRNFRSHIGQRMHARCCCYSSRRINRHKFVSYRVMRVSDIADHLRAAWEGEGAHEISSAAPLESAARHE